MQAENPDQGYTINFKNVSVIEFIQFVSKVAGVNFIYEEEELDFNVTVVSEEPTNITNVVSALIQVLRANNLEVLDQGDNLIINKQIGGAKLATVISDEVQYEGPSPPQLITRVFRINNANPTQLGSLIAPMLSSHALVEVSAITRHLIITDITGNVDKIADLMKTLDAPQSAFEIDAYKAKSSSPAELVEFAKRIVTPIAEGNPVIMVPQEHTSTVFVISTPYLVERTMGVLEDLDSPVELNPVQRAKLLSGESFFLYKIKYKPYSDIRDALINVSDHLQQKGFAPVGLISTIDNMKYIEQSNSILFSGTPEAIDKLKQVLAEIDTPTKEQQQQELSSEFLMYHPKYRSGEELLVSIQDLAKSLSESNLTDPNFLHALQSAKWVSSTNSLVFTGSPQSLQRIQNLLQIMDSPTAHKQGKDIIFVYKIQYAPEEKLEQGLEEFAKTLDDDDPKAREIVETIDNMKYLPDSNSMVFKGQPAAINKIKEVLSLLDVPAAKVTPVQKTYQIYKAKNVSGQTLIEDLNRVAKNLSSSGVDNTNVIQAIKSIEYISATNSLLITGTPEAIDQVVSLLEKFDVSRGAQVSQYFMYKPQFKSAQEIQQDLLAIAQDMQKAGLANPDLINTITTMRYVEATDSILFTGTPTSIQEVQSLLTSIDVSTAVPGIQKVGKITFLIYKIKYASGPQLLSSLKALTNDLDKVGADKELVETLNNARYIKETNSIIFTGPAEALQKAEKLAERFDIPALAAPTEPQPERPAPEVFKLYKPRCLPGEELIHIMQDFEQNLIDSGVNRRELFDAINNLKWIPKTSSILVSGQESAVNEIMDLLQRFDNPSALPHIAEVPPPMQPFDDVSFLIYKLHYHQGTEIVAALKQVAQELQTSSVGNANAKLIDAINSVQWVQVTNSLLGTGEPKTLAKLRELVQNIDVPLRQIFIEVLVIDTTTTDILDFGLTWASQGKITSRIGFATGSTPSNAGVVESGNGNLAQTFTGNLRNISATRTPTGTDVPFSTGFDLGIIGDLILHKGRTFAALGSLINAIKTDTTSTIVLNQKIITQDSRNSTIFVGQNIPFTGSTVTTVGQNSQQSTANLEYRDIGFSLSLTPTIGENNIITMEIDTEISDTVGPPPDTSTLQGITTNKATTTTRVHVPDDSFLVLSGQVRNTNSRSKTGIPCLGSLPVVGAAFSRTATQKDKSNIMIFMRPKIVDAFETYEMITDRQEEICRDEGNPDDVEEGFELVKTPDDE